MKHRIKQKASGATVAVATVAVATVVAATVAAATEAAATEAAGLDAATDASVAADMAATTHRQTLRQKPSLRLRVRLIATVIVSAMHLLKARPLWNP